MSSTRNILVVGATGKQGGAVINALQDRPLPFAVNILALTRNPDSPSAKALSQRHPSITLIKGDLADSDAIFAQLTEPLWALFLVTDAAFGKKSADGTDLETHNGTSMIHAAAAHKVAHIIFSSVDRGGEPHSFSNPTKISHFATKHAIELALRETVQQNADPTHDYTIIRPVAFMDNMGPNAFGRLFASMWADMGDKKLQLVAVRDIGVLARNALASADEPDSPFRNRAIGLAGDELTQAEADEVFWRVYDRPMPRAWWLSGKLLQTLVKEVGVMFGWFKDEGYGVDIAALKGQYRTETTSWEQYLRDVSVFKR